MAMEKSTDELVHIIVTQIGVPLPVMDYNKYGKFIITLPHNVSIGSVTGIEKSNMFDTFKEACQSIVKHG